MFWRNAVAETPTGHGEAFREPINDDSALRHSRQSPWRKVFAAKKDARINFVTEQPEIVFLREIREAMQRAFVKYRARRVVRGIENQNAGFGRNL